MAKNVTKKCAIIANSDHLILSTADTKYTALWKQVSFQIRHETIILPGAHPTNPFP
jgi:hypothetical protein